MSKLLALRLGLRKRAPKQFTYARSNNFFSQTLENPNTGKKVLVESIAKRQIQGLEWSDKDNLFKELKTIEISELSNWELNTYRFYGGARYQYDGVWDFWKNELTFRAWRNHFWGDISQSLFNTVFRFRSDRIEVLRRLVELHVEAAKNGNGPLNQPEAKSVVQMQSDFFGNKVYGHPAYNDISARFRLIVDSLASSGDLVEENAHHFRVDGKALETLAAFELDERRHNDAVKQNKRLFWITVVIAVATAVQAYVAFFSS